MLINLSIPCSSFCGKGNNKAFQDETTPPKKQYATAFPLDWAPKKKIISFKDFQEQNTGNMDSITKKLSFGESEDEASEKNLIDNLGEELNKLKITKTHPIEKPKKK